MSHARIYAMLEESGFDHDEMAEVVDALAPLSELADQAPAPSAELAALFGHVRDGAVARATDPRSRARGAAVGAVVIALSSIGATGLSAAANTLPRPLQHEVAEFSRDHLPFDLPEPPPPGQPFGAELPLQPGVVEEGLIGPRPVPLTPDFTRGADRPGRFPSASPSAGPTAATASSQPSFMPSPSPTYSSSPSGSPSPDKPSESPGKTPSPNQGGEDGNEPKRPPKDKNHGFGPSDGKEHKPGKDKDKGNGPGPGNGPGDGGGQDEGGGQGEDNDGGGLPELPPPLSLPDPPPPSPAPELLPGADLPTDASLPGPE